MFVEPTIVNESKVLIAAPESLTIIGSDKPSFNRSMTGLGNAFDTFNQTKSGVSLFQSYIQNKRNHQTSGLRSPSPLFEKPSKNPTKSLVKLANTG